MEYKIKKITEREFGKTESIWYDVVTFRRSWLGIFFGIIIPVYGWIYLFMFNPFKKEWKTVHSFDEYTQALYYINNDCVTSKTKEEFVEIKSHKKT